MREDVIANLSSSKSNLSAAEFLEQMDARYKLDVYNSLSIEGYRVTDEFINKVKSGAWKPDAFFALKIWLSRNNIKSSIVYWNLKLYNLQADFIRNYTGLLSIPNIAIPFDENNAINKQRIKFIISTC